MTNSGHAATRNFAVEFDRTPGIGARAETQIWLGFISPHVRCQFRFHQLPSGQNAISARIHAPYLCDKFAEAVDQDFLFKDPSARVKVPKNLRETDTTTLAWDQLRMALELLDESDRILVELDITDALRPSELFALREVLRARELPAGPAGGGIPEQDPSLWENPQRSRAGSPSTGAAL